MVDVIGYGLVMLLIIGFTYGLVRQIQHTLIIQRANRPNVSNLQEVAIWQLFIVYFIFWFSRFVYFKRFSCDAIYPVEFIYK